MDRRKLIYALIVVALLGVAGWIVGHSSNPCGDLVCSDLDQAAGGTTLWFSNEEPRPGSVFRLRALNGIGHAEGISDYLADKIPQQLPRPSADESWLFNDLRKIEASTALLKQSAPSAVASAMNAKSIQFQANDVTIQRIPKRLQVVTLLDELDGTRKETTEAAELFEMLTRALPPSNEADGPDGGLYMITEVRRATTLHYNTADRERERLGNACDPDSSSKCAKINVGRTIYNRVGRNAQKVAEPLAFRVVLARIGTRTLIRNGKRNANVRYDADHPGPTFVTD